MESTPFFVSFFERSGSTLLHSLLNQHPDISCRAEVFDLKRIEGTLQRLPELSDTQDVINLLNSIYGKDYKANGFKFKYPTQYEYYPDVYEYLLKIADQIRVIFLYRKNRLKGAISKQNQIRLRRLGKPSNLDKDNFIELGKLKLDIEQAFKYVEIREKQDEKYFRRLEKFKDKFMITYEDLSKNTEKSIQNIYEFLNVDNNYQPQNKTIKITNDHIENVIENYQELIEKITCTRYEQYLD